ncbi:ThuA domain-containing protein [Demequina flava]|uniref:ThuA domain-containing protein n=1 Tax=Demequina flava TaxID=1095025 RepID=UPI000780E1CA|nr:ThuA domain-containing protein [Demequina flava]
MSRLCLIVRGGWPGHDPVASTEKFIPVLENLGFSLDIEDTPEVYADASAMARYDLIVQSVTMGSATVDEVAGLRAAVAAGAGLTGWHGGLIDSYRNSAEYLHLTGAQFAAHPPAGVDRGRTDVEPYRSYTVTPTAEGAQHPITSGMEAFDITTEHYWVLTDPHNRVLLTSVLSPDAEDEWDEPVTMPVAWTRQWGKGRIFATTLGHTLDVLDRPDVHGLIERGLDWAAR